MHQRALGGAPGCAPGQGGDPERPGSGRGGERGPQRGQRAEHHLDWRRATVQGRPACYGVGGNGLPVVFLHGWALGQHSYKRALKRLVRLGCRVLAPALPGFGGTADLPRDESCFGGYARWLGHFLEAVGVEEPVLLVGHSYGGAVAIAAAHDLPDTVRRLVLVNSIGAGSWASGEEGRPLSLNDRSLWEWALRLPAEVLPLPDLFRAVPVLLEDALPNIVHNPLAVWRAANLCRQADLSAELAELRRRRLPVEVFSATEDRLVPRGAFESLCSALRVSGEVVAGRHCWMLTDPDAFGAALARIVEGMRGEDVRGPGEPSIAALPA